MTKQTKEMNGLSLAGKATFYLSLLFLLFFLLLAFSDRISLALTSLHLMFVFWGANKVIVYFMGGEIRLTYAVKVSENAPKIIRRIALVFCALVALYGLIELCS